MGNPLEQDLDHILAHTEGLWDEVRGKQIFITGGTGFLGCWLVESFVWANDRLGLNAKAVVLTRSPGAFRHKAPHLADHPAIQLHAGDVRSFKFPAEEFSHVIHAATEANAKLYDENPLLMLDTIVNGTRRALEFAQRCGARKFLLTSSGAVYGKQPPDLSHVPEDYSSGPDLLDPRSAYGEGKRMAELLCTLHARQYGLSVKIARCFAFVGPYLPLDIHFAIGNFIRDGLLGGPIQVKGDGTPYRSYLYAADLAIWLWKILFRGGACRAYNVGSDEALSIAELAQKVAQAFTPPLSVYITKTAVPGQLAERYVPAIKRAKAELDLDQWITLPEAIERTLRWHKRSSENSAIRPVTRPCPICGNASGEVLHTLKFVLPEGYPPSADCAVLTCPQCGFAYADTPADQRDYDEFYARYSKYADNKTSTGGGGLALDAERLKATAADIARVITDKHARIADIGCANGGLLKALRDLGYTNLCGLDPSSACVTQTAQIPGVNGYVGSLSHIPPEAGPFDCVILLHVLEHVKDLRPALAHVRKSLKPGARLYVETPDASRYADFAFAPFQDFNTEHINHFSLASMANLLRQCSFTVTSSGTKLLMSAPGMPYPALFMFAVLEDTGTHDLQKDDQLKACLVDYIATSRRVMTEIDRHLRHVLAGAPEVIVWGTGQLAMKLLAETSLAEAKIVNFVDSNPINQGRHLKSIPIIAPEQVNASTIPIIVTSVLHHQAIAARIHQLGLTNPVIALRPELLERRA